MGNFKRILSVVMAAAVAGSMFVGASKKDEGEWKFKRKIEIVCPWGAGGGADTTLRQFATALEKELGVSVVVNNKSGAGGVSGVQYAAKQPNDGYTWLLCTPSPLLAQISGATSYDVYGNIEPVCQLVHDCNVFVTSSKSPFNNYAELMDYVEKNPGSVSCGVMTITGLDAACVIGAFGDKIEAVAYTEGSQLNSDVIGQHVALACVGPAEVAAMIASGDMKAILVCAEERLSLPGYEEVESAGELGLENALFGPARGIFCRPGTPEAAVKAFEAAAEKAVASEEFQAWAASEGLNQRQGWLNTADYKAAWDADYADLTELFGKK